MRTVPRRMPSSNQLPVFGTTILRQGDQKVEETEVRMQNSHVSLRSTLAATSPRRSPTPCKASCPNFIVSGCRPIEPLWDQCSEDYLREKEGTGSTRRVRENQRSRWVTQPDQFASWPHLLRPFGLDAGADCSPSVPNYQRDLLANGQT